jgi:hypothetical protein
MYILNHAFQMIVPYKLHKFANCEKEPSKVIWRLKKYWYRMTIVAKQSQNAYY